MNDMGTPPVSFIKKWCVVSTAVFDSANGTALPNIPNRVPFQQGAIVEPTGEQAVANGVQWLEVIHRYKENVREEKRWVERAITGWVNGVFLDDLNEQFPGYMLNIPDQTEEPTDAQQYIYVEGVKRVNLCGEFCVTFIVQRDKRPDIDIVTLLKEWKDRPGSYYNEVLAETKDAGTTPRHLKNLLGMYGYIDGGDTEEGDITNLSSGAAGHSISPGDMAAMLRTHYLMARIKSNVKGCGELLPIDQGADFDERNHWVVVDRISRNGKAIVLFNPFSNKLEEYSYTEFFASCTASMLSGLWVRRGTSSIGQQTGQVAGRDAFVGVHIDRPLNAAAKQYLMIGGEKKTELCGEFSVAYILSRSIDRMVEQWKPGRPTGFWELSTILKAYGYYREDVKSFSMEWILEYWKEVQPKFYEYYVGQNKPTGLWQLKSILRAYGYNNSGDFTEFTIGIRNETSIGQYLPSPGRMSRMLKDHYLIAGVAIDKVSGRLVKRGKLMADSYHYTAHWIVVESLEPDGRHYQTRHWGGSGGWVKLYNPFNNTQEEYSYREFTDAMSEQGAWDGLWVKRGIVPKFEEQEILFPLTETEEEVARRGPDKKKKVIVKRWTEARIIEEVEKKVRRGRPLERIPAMIVAAGSGWRKDEIVRYLPRPAKPDAEPEKDVESVVGDILDVEVLPADVAKFFKTASNKDTVLAVELAKALLDAGVLLAGEGGQCRFLDLPVTSGAREAAVSNFINNLSLSHREGSTTGSELTLKVANMIRPALASRTILELPDSK